MASWKAETCSRPNVYFNTILVLCLTDSSVDIILIRNRPLYTPENVSPDLQNSNVDFKSHIDFKQHKETR
jgi:hypothetical protein